MPDGGEIDISELPRDVPPDEPGWHIFDYEGGVDFGALFAAGRHLYHCCACGRC